MDVYLYYTYAYNGVKIKLIDRTRNKKQEAVLLF